MKNIVLNAALLCLLGCTSTGSSTRSEGAMKVDGATKESTDRSLKEMMNSLPNRNRCLLQAAVMRIQMGDPELNKENNLGLKLKNMTSEQVVTLSQEYPEKIVALCRD